LITFVSSNRIVEKSSTTVNDMSKSCMKQLYWKHIWHHRDIYHRTLLLHGTSDAVHLVLSDQITDRNLDLQQFCGSHRPSISLLIHSSAGLTVQECRLLDLIRSSVKWPHQRPDGTSQTRSHPRPVKNFLPPSTLSLLSLDIVTTELLLLQLTQRE
jgi:hypothetical protein